MELDFPTVKALSSPTRIKILHEVLQHESTPTSLSKGVDRSKSTIVSHLQVLEDAGLVEKDVVEGRRRVIYAPTSKAKAIVEGRERKVRFAITSSVMTLVAAVGSAGYAQQLITQRTAQAADSTAQAAGRMESLAMAQADQTATVTEQAAHEAPLLPFDPVSALWILAVVSLGLAAALFVYGLTVNKLGSDLDVQQNES